MTTLALPGGPATQRRCALYRHFDDQDVLLYVGITESLGDRTNSGHARTSDWVQFAVRAEAEWLDSRDLASSAERDAFEHERPVFNRQYAEGTSTGRSWSICTRARDRALQSVIAEEYEFVVRRFLARVHPRPTSTTPRAKALERLPVCGHKARSPLPGQRPAAATPTPS
jgi:hypothetical protein